MRLRLEALATGTQIDIIDNAIGLFDLSNANVLYGNRLDAYNAIMKEYHDKLHRAQEIINELTPKTWSERLF